MTFNKADITAAYQLLGIRYHMDARWGRALARGWDNLTFRRWQWDGVTLQVQSTSEPEKRYSVTADGCQCYAASKQQICDHMAAWHLCNEASKIHNKPTPRPARIQRDVEADAAALFN